jgi:tetratricopeptide (TPR) repeat protein
LQTLRQGFPKSPVLVLAAGAGYGKSTLLASYGGLWLSLGDEAKDPVVLGWHLLEAYRPRLKNPTEIEGALERGAWTLAGETLLEEVSGLEPHTLVLDEAQRAASREAVSLVRTLAQAPKVNVAVLSRRAAPWEVLGRVIGEAELAFDPNEALLLARALAPELPAFEVERAHSLVRGWPLGLRLLLRAMQRGIQPEEAFYAHPDAAGLLAYLLPGLPEAVQKLAARASVLGEFGPDETGPLGASDVSLEFYAEDLLLERVGSRLRFHPLVRRALMGTLKPAETRTLLTKAAEAATERGEGVRAAGYLLEAGRLGHAADLLLEQGEGWLASGLMHTVLSLLDRMPESLVRARPGLVYLRAEALRQAGRYAQAEAAYREARSAGVDRALLGLSRLYLDTVEPAKAWPYLDAAQAQFPGPARNLRAENLLNAGRVEEALALGLTGPRVLLRSGDPVGALELLREALVSPRSGEALVSPRSGVGITPVFEADRPPENHREDTLLLSLLEAVAGNAQAAEIAALRGRKQGEAMGSPFVVALAEARLGHALLAQNRWEEARAAYGRALSLAEGGPGRLKVEALGGVAATGEDSTYTEMVRLARESGDAWVEAFMTLTLAYARLRQGKIFALPTLAVRDPFLLELAETYPWREGGAETLDRYPFLAETTLFAPPLERVRRLLWEMGRLEVFYHPGVRVEIRALGGLSVEVNGEPVRFKREKTQILLALLLLRDWSKEELIEALEVSDGEFRVLWSELLHLLEPGRPARSPGYFCKPYGLARVPELRVDLWELERHTYAPPFAGLEHPLLEEARAEVTGRYRDQMLRRGDEEALLEALRLEPLDEPLVERLLRTAQAEKAWAVHAQALRELGLEPDPRLAKLRPNPPAAGTAR